MSTGNSMVNKCIKLVMRWCNQTMDMVLLVRQTLSLALLLALLLQTFNRNLIVADYYANTQAYEANCVNKEKPLLQCHGKCQVQSRLQQEEKKDAQNPERKLENKQEIVWTNISDNNLLTAPFLTNTDLHLFVPVSLGQLPTNCFDIFQPPRA